MRSIFIWTIGLVTMAATMPVVARQQIGRSPIEVGLPDTPAVVHALGRRHLVYELHLTNMGRADATVDRLTVADGEGRTLVDWPASDLGLRMSVVGQPAAAGPTTTIAPGRRAIVWMWISLASGQSPSSLAHRLVASSKDAGPETIVTRAVRVGPPADPTGAPVGAGTWVAVRGPSPASAHRLGLVTADGTTRVPQRFAVDWVRLGDDGRPFRDEPKVMTNWQGWDATVHAVAPGTVVLVRDGAADHPAMDVSVPDVLDREAAPGNVVVIDLGGGRFASYAHLRQGSAAVAVGDRVRAGQVLARVGNSGNSLAPHLHFQLADAAEPLAGEGLPFSLDRFELVGRVQSLATLLAGTPWMPSAAMPSRIVERETPMENMVIRLSQP